MNSVLLVSQPFTDDGTFSDCVTNGGFKFVTGELPWRDNRRDRSCIKGGVYRCVRDVSPHNGPCYRVLNVDGHDNIEWHRANLMGDVEKGKVSQLLGCFAPGAEVLTFEKGFEYKKGLFLPAAQRGVTASKATLEKLFEFLGNEFELTVKRPWEA